MKVEVRGVAVELFGVEVTDAEVIALGYYAPEDTRGPAVIAGREFVATPIVAGLRAYGLPAPLDLDAPLVWEATK